MKESILIVGAGPTGLTAALVLAKRGLKPKIIDKRREPISTSNALAIQPGTLELWEKLGLIDDALAMGHPLHGMTITNGKKLMGQITTDSLPTKYPFVLALPQVKTEKLLTKHLEELGVHIERGVTLESLQEKDGFVEVTCNGEKNRYAWVIGCDGAKSVVREYTGIPFRGNEMPQHFIMADLQIEWEKDADRGHVFYSNDGPIAFFPLDDKGYGRLIFEVTQDKRLKTETQPTFDDFKQLMQQRCDIPAKLSTPSWISSFWIHSRIVDNYRKGRLFLAGDAAHLHSPFGGQGLNTGVRDAAFLADLLADVIEGKRSSAALNDYNTIRRKVGKGVVERTELMTKLITTTSPLVRRLRNAFFTVALKVPFIRKKAMLSMSQL